MLLTEPFGVEVVGLFLRQRPRPQALVVEPTEQRVLKVDLQLVVGAPPPICRHLFLQPCQTAQDFVSRAIKRTQFEHSSEIGRVPGVEAEANVRQEAFDPDAGGLGEPRDPGESFSATALGNVHQLDDAVRVQRCQFGFAQVHDQVAHVRAERYGKRHDGHFCVRASAHVWSGGRLGFAQGKAR